MFNNIGGKIKGLAVFICVIGIIASIAWASSIINMMTCILVIAGGSILSWLGSMTLYGFGELIEEVSNMRKEVDELKGDIGTVKFYLKTMCDIMNKQDNEREQ